MATPTSYAELSIPAGLGLIVFEITELAWIGLQLFEIIFGVVGAAVLVLAVRQGSSISQIRRSEGSTEQTSKARRKENP